MGEQEGKEENKKSDKSNSHGCNDKDRDFKENKDGDQKQKHKKTPVYKKPAFIITASIILVILIGGGIITWFILRQYVSTDDAFIDGHVIQISPQVSAQVKVLHITDNQLIRQGDLLLELDPTDYDVVLQQAEAQVSEAEGRLEQARAQAASANAALLPSRGAATLRPGLIAKCIE
jgi:membrane fusion protein, multidrug efflux system